MKRFVWVALAFVPLVFSVAACKKAHDTGNDNMRAPGGAITATGGQSDTVRADTVRAMPVASSSSMCKDSTWHVIMSTDASPQIRSDRTCLPRNPILFSSVFRTRTNS